MNERTRPNLALTAGTGAGAPQYLTGFGNGFESEALPGALPVGRNSPQKCPYGLYAEQLSGSPFTAPRKTNERSWLYRIRPTVAHWGDFKRIDRGLWRTAPAPEVEQPIAPLRWDPIPMPKTSLSFVEGIHTITTAGDAASAAGMGAHVYIATRSMADEYFYNADGEMLFAPQQGALRLATEFGIIAIEPGEVAIIPRGVKLRVELVDEQPPLVGGFPQALGDLLAIGVRRPHVATMAFHHRTNHISLGTARPETVMRHVAFLRSGESG